MTPTDGPGRNAPERAPDEVVLDTAALLAGVGPGGTGAAGRAATTRWLCPPAVRAEVRPGGATGRSVAHAESAGLRVVAPTPEALDRVSDEATQSGDLASLSLADREVIALAWDRSRDAATELWSDDYAVQNVARRLGLVVRGVLTRGGGQTLTWHVRCTGCGRYPDVPPETPCPICGSPLKRTRRAPRPGER